MLIIFYSSLMAIKTKDGIETFSLALNGSGLASYLDEDQWVWLPTFCQIPGRGLQLFASAYIVKEDGSASIPKSPKSPPLPDNLATQIYHRDFYELGLSRLPGFDKVSDSDAKKYAELFRLTGNNAKSPAFIKHKIQSLRKTPHARSELEVMLRKERVRVTKANVKTLEEILGYRYQSCRTVRLISDLKNRGVVSNLLGDVARVGDGATGALGTAL